MYVIVISTCLKLKKGPETSRADFHFNGHFNGQKITNIVVSYPADKYQVRKGKEYIIHMRVDDSKDEVLFGQIKRLKALEDVQLVI